MSTHVCLNLLIPVHAEDRLVDFLLAQDDQRIEFSMHGVAARGPLVKMARGEDRVRGFATRMQAQLVLPTALCDRLLQPLADLLAGVDGGYWVVPVQQFAPFAGEPRTGHAAQTPQCSA